MTEPTPERLPSPFATGLACRCPRCGEGPLFTGFLKPVSRCESCGEDLSFAAATEGPAVFIILIVGFVIVGAAATVEGLFHPPPFVHLLLWLPGTVILSLLLLRPLKATMVALQYHNRAGEGRIDG
ncbi:MULTISPECIES: DUF983 domain-containing protein [unclassified Devosia]|uniref:DUF983 domain-containing protein n=1 Tax=unclassified Devosia TaxID=196773 RepID=UPI00086D4F58|nr:MULTISPECIES: DUF983 domain-containing protein [unclassified Devosia]MBN9360483.1 DUF983 domain-containing protein [Devosia sp.]ODS94462.1 MAG: hypothetical protein ABS47_05960 [Devosia sp. SCN 66-27]OJX22485.1 MAG: hypothetical protein BGO83_16835 [Devosia sp. 66-14]